MTKYPLVQWLWNWLHWGIFGLGCLFLLAIVLMLFGVGQK